MGRISDFKSHLGVGARANRFRVTLNFPAVSSGGQAETRQASFLCKGAQLPPSTVARIDVNYHGRVLPIPGDRTFPDWPITILADQTYDIRDALESWSNAINTHDGNVGNDDLNAIVADLVVEHLDQNDNVLKAYTIRDAWPTEVAAIELSFDSGNTISEYGATFAMSEWVSNTTT